MPTNSPTSAERSPLRNWEIAFDVGTTSGSPSLHPWQSGDFDQRWRGYFIPGTEVLRNRVGATTADALRDAENDLVEARIIELRESASLLGDRSYDLAFLQAIHRQLFQDVYEWASDVRTVGIEKGHESFCPPNNIAQATNHVASRIWELERLVAASANALPRTIAYLYDYVNFAHPLREGNGRATREFFDLLLSERGAGLDWEKTDLAELHAACHAARASSDLSGLITMFDRD